LVIEIDGGQHNDTRAKDAVRTEKIERAGYALIRFWNREVMREIDAILVEIDRALSAGT
jgi:very-short-patch-repair endonuclease